MNIDKKLLWRVACSCSRMYDTNSHQHLEKRSLHGEYVLMRDPHTQQTKSMEFNMIQSCIKQWQQKYELFIANEWMKLEKRNKLKLKSQYIQQHPSSGFSFERLTKIKAARFSITSFHHFESVDVRFCRPSGNFQLSVQLKNKCESFELMVIFYPTFSAQRNDVKFCLEKINFTYSVFFVQTNKKIFCCRHLRRYRFVLFQHI